jgi:hypothetical protein
VLAAQSACTPCVAGRYSAIMGASASTTCIACGKGKASPAPAQTSSAACVNCLGQSVAHTTGKYADTAGMSTCKACPTGKLASVAGLAACNAQGGGASLCDAGKHSDGTDCQDCPVGRAKAGTSPQETPATCAVCTKGTFQAQTAQAACVACPTGKFNTVTSATACDAAVAAGTPGAVAPADQKQAVATTLKFNGFTVNTFASAQGAFKAAIASLIAGVEAADVIITDVKDVANRRLSAATAVAMVISRALLAGNGVTVQFEVQKPTAGAAQSVQTAMAALDASALVTTLRTEMTTAGLTPPPALAAAIVVVPQVEVTTCGAGYFFATQGATSAASCAECPAGKFKAAAGQASAQCEACHVNFAQAVTGQTSCAACPAGQVQPLMGKPSCELPSNGCTPGRFFSNGVCNDCAAGRAQPAALATSCVSCATGRYQPNTGKATCTKCDDGHIAATAQTACTSCAAGTSQTGLNACSACPFGTVQPESGKVACDACAASTKAQTGSRIACTTCGAQEICAGGAAAARPKPAPTSRQSNRTDTAAPTLKTRLKKVVKKARERGAEMTAYFVFSAVGILVVLFHRVLPQNVLKKLDQYSMAHHVQDGAPLIKRITALGGAFAVLALCFGTVAAINIASSDNTLVGTSVQPLSSEDTPVASFTLDIVAYGSANCSVITGLQGGAADTVSAVVADSTGGCAFSFTCLDCDLLGEVTRSFVAPWDVQHVEYTLSMDTGDPSAPRVRLSNALRAPAGKLLWAGTDTATLKRQQRERFAVTPDYFVDETAEAAQCTTEGECLGAQASDSTTSAGRRWQSIAEVNADKSAISIAEQAQRFEFVFQRSTTKSVTTKSNKQTPIQLASLCLNTLLSLLSLSAIAFNKLEPVLSKKLKVKANDEKGGGDGDDAGKSTNPLFKARSTTHGQRHAAKDALSAIVVRDGEEATDDAGRAADGAGGSAANAPSNREIQQNEKIEQLTKKIEQLTEKNEQQDAKIQQQNEKSTVQQAKLDWLIKEVTSRTAGSAAEPEDRHLRRGVRPQTPGGVRGGALRVPDAAGHQATV